MLEKGYKQSVHSSFSFCSSFPFNFVNRGHTIAIMQCIQNYGNSSSDSESDNGESTAHLRPVDTENSVAKTLSVVAAPAVVPLVNTFFLIYSIEIWKTIEFVSFEHNLNVFLYFQGNSSVSRVIDPISKELTYNPKYEELFAPVQGPENPFLTNQQRAQRNTLSGFVEKAHISAFNFENQRRTFHTYGYALDPSVNDPDNDGQTYIGDVQAAYDTNGKTVFESPRPKPKRKQERNDHPEDIEGFSGPWAKYENEQTVARPTDEQKAELDEILAKRHRRNRIPEEKPLEEKSILHSMLNCIVMPFCILL